MGCLTLWQNSFIPLDWQTQESKNMWCMVLELVKYMQNFSFGCRKWFWKLFWKPEFSCHTKTVSLHSDIANKSMLIKKRRLNNIEVSYFLFTNLERHNVKVLKWMRDVCGVKYLRTVAHAQAASFSKKTTTFS